MLTETVTFDAVTLTLRRPTYGDRLARAALYDRLLEGHADLTEQERTARFNFAYLTTQTTEAVGLAWELPTAALNADEVEARYRAFLDTDDVLIQRWITASNHLAAAYDPNGERRSAT